jgi:hypothetical protein
MGAKIKGKVNALACESIVVKKKPPPPKGSSGRKRKFKTEVLIFECKYILKTLN